MENSSNTTEPSVYESTMLKIDNAKQSAASREIRVPMDIEGILARLRSSFKGEIDDLQLSELHKDEILLALDRGIAKVSTCWNTCTPELNQAVYKLNFKHRCQALGCAESNCDLCESNPKRGCTSHFDRKYFKGDIIRAKCGGSLFIEILDHKGESISPTEIDSDGIIELTIIDGNKFEQLYPHGVVNSDNLHHLETCIILVGNEGRPLLHSDEKSHNRDNGKVCVPVQGVSTSVSDLSVHCSSEALLSGRRPPFRLAAKYVSVNKKTSVFLPAVSSNFIVASGRSRLSQKKTIPFVDDPVSRLANMGKERIRKLANLALTAKEMAVDYPRHSPQKISTVADFKRLAFEADTDGQLKQKILHMLKMSEKAWEETRDHAACAISNDTRMRAWTCPESVSMEGLIYTCYLGETDIHKPVALLTDASIILKECLDVGQRTLMKQLQDKALASWWKPNHPGWTFFHFDSEEFRKVSPFSLLTGQEKLAQNHASLLEARNLRSEVQSKRRADRVSTETEGKGEAANCGNQGRGNSMNSMSTQQGKSKLSNRRIMLREGSVGGAPMSPPSPETIRSPYETDQSSKQGLPEVVGSGTESRFLPYSEPVIPRAPPDSAFTRRMERSGEGGRRDELLNVNRLDSSVLQHFYVTSSASNNRPLSSSGFKDVYGSLQTPFNTIGRTLGEVVQEQMSRNAGRPSESEEDGHLSQDRRSAEGLLSLNRAVTPTKRTPLCTSHDFVVPTQPIFDCSIDSLPSMCKDAICEEQRIRQMENCGYSNQDVQHSFDGSIGHRHKRPRTTEVPIQFSDCPMAITDNSIGKKDKSDSQSGLMSYRILFVPVSNEGEDNQLPPVSKESE